MGHNFQSYMAKNTDEEKRLTLMMMTEYTIAPNFQNIFHQLAEDNKIQELNQLLTDDLAKYLTC